MTYTKDQQKILKQANELAKKWDTKGFAQVVSQNKDLSKDFTKIWTAYNLGKKTTSQNAPRQSNEPSNRWTWSLRKKTSNTRNRTPNTRVGDNGATIIEVDRAKEKKESREKQNKQQNPKDLVGDRDFYDNIQKARWADNEQFENRINQDENYKNRVKATEAYYWAKDEKKEQEQNDHFALAREGFQSLLDKNPTDPYVEEYMRSYPQLRKEFEPLKQQALQNHWMRSVANNYAQSDVDTIRNGINGYNILPWTSAFDELEQRNPNATIATNQARASEHYMWMLNGNDLEPYDTKKASTSILEQIMSNFSRENDLAQYDSFLKSDEINGASKGIEDTEQEIISIQKTLQNVEKQVEKELWAEVPQSIIESEVALRSEGLYEKAQLLFTQKQSQEANYNRLVEQGTKRFEIAQAEEESRKAFLTQMYGVVRSEEIREEDIIRENLQLDQKIKREEVKYKRDIERQDSVLAEQRQYDIEKLKEDRRYNLDILATKRGWELSDLEKKYELEREKYLAENGVPIDYMSSNMQEGVATMNGKSIYNFSLNKDGSVRVAWVEVWKTPQNGRGQCWEFTNDCLFGKPWFFWNTYKEKQDKVNSQAPVAWSAFIMQTKSQWGHVGIVEKVLPNGDIEVVDSNWKGNEKVDRRTIKKGSNEYKKITGYYVPPELKDMQRATNAPQLLTNGGIRTSNGISYNRKEVEAKNDEIIKNPRYESLGLAEDMQTKLSSLENLFDKYWTEDGWWDKLTSPWDRAQMNSAYQQFMLTAKEFFNLGVLAWPDMDILEWILANPTEIKRNSRIEGGIEQMKVMINEKLENDMKSIKTLYGDFGPLLSGYSDAERIYQSVSGKNPNPESKEAIQRDIEEYVLVNGKSKEEVARFLKSHGYDPSDYNFNF